MRKIVIVIVIALITSEISTGQVVWNQYDGPYMGQVLSFASVGDTIIAGTELTGIFQSNDNGIHWEQTEIKQGPINSIHISDSATFAALNGVPLIKRKGSDYFKYYSSLGGIYQFYEFNGSVFAATVFGIFKYDLSSDVWIEKSNGLEENDGYGSRWVENITSIDTTLFCGTFKTGMYFSNDMGENWAEISLISSLGNDSTKNVIYKNDNLSSKSYLSIDRIKNMVNKNDTLIVTDFEERNIYESTDTGKSWNKIPFTNETNIFFNDLEVFNDSLVLATSMGVYKNKSNSSWELISEEAFDILYVQGDLLLASNKFGVYRWDNFLNQFVLSNIGINTAYVYDVIEFDSSLYSVTRSGAFYTDNDGESWHSIDDLKNVRAHSINVLDSMIYIGSLNGILGKSKASNEWIEYNNGIASLAVWDIVVDDTILLAGTDGGLFKSVDYGKEWIPVSSDLGAVSKISVGNGIVLASSYSGLFKIAYDGSKELVGFENGGIGTVEIIDTEVYVSGTMGGIYKSIDSCKTWISLNESFGSYHPLIYDIFKRGNNNIYASSTMYIYYSPDGGSHWEEWSETGMPNSHIYRVYQSDSCLFAATFGTSIWKRKYLKLTNCESDEYDVDTTESKSKGATISNVPPHITINELNSNIRIAHGASLDVYQDGTLIDETSYLKSGDVLKITAEDYKTFKEYSIVIIGEEMFNVLAQVNNSGYGSVTGGGEYQTGSTVTLTATAFDGFNFINWTIDDNEVSINQEYSFIADKDISIFANFEMASTSIGAKNDFKIKLFPNPATDEIRIEFFNKGDLKELELLNINGRTIKNYKVSSQGIGKLNIGVGNLEPGVYFFKISDDNQSEVQKIIIQQ